MLNNWSLRIQLLPFSPGSLTCFYPEANYPMDMEQLWFLGLLPALQTKESVFTKWCHFFFFLLLSGGQLLCSVVLVSSIQQHESVIWYQPYHTYDPFLLSLSAPTPSYLSRLSQSTSLSSLPWAICFTCGNVYISVLASQFIPPSPSPSESISSMSSVSVSLFLPSMEVH